MSRFLFLLVAVFAVAPLCPVAAQQGIHPLMEMENVYPANDVALKVSAMCFAGNDLYVTVFTPDRQNQAPFKEGEIFRVTGLIGGGPILAEKVMGGLYEPTGLAGHAGKFYLGEKDRISRLDDRNADGRFTADEKTVLIDGLSQPNFHTYTVGFGLMQRDGQTWLGGNLTTSILLGGKRDFNITVNAKTHRGSTFLLGPVTGAETAAEVDIRYLAGGFRTPNGYGITRDGAAIVVDNQGVFNPTNEFIRVSEGGFYGHYLLPRADANVSAFQPEKVDAVHGGAEHQTPITVHLPQQIVARSPAQPLELSGLVGDLAVYNGQFLVPDVTLGAMTRVFIEEVGGVWQGAVFRHSSGYDAEGKNGFTAGPNRIIPGPDGKYYIGGIGVGGLWRILAAPGEPYTGLQRLSFREKEKRPADFNEMVAVRDTVEGFEIEFFRPLEKAPAPESVSLRQWTYIPTSGYGGAEVGLEDLTPKSLALSADGRRLRIAVDGLRDNSPPFVERRGYSNRNAGWVVNIRLSGLGLWADQAWYTLNKHLGKTATTPVELDSGFAVREPIKYAEKIHAAVCAACHAIDGPQLVGPNFRGLFGSKQRVVTRNRGVVEMTADDGYLVRAITDPTADYREGFPPAMPDPGLLPEEARAIVKWLRTLP